MKSPDKKNKHKIITAKNFYRPKTFTPYTYNRFMKQFVDKNTWGWNNKRHYYSKWFINACIISQNKKYWKRCHSTFRRQVDHLKNQGTLYFTNNPNSNLALFVADIDPLKINDVIISSPEDMKAARKFLSSIFPDCYSEPSSSGQGLHYYFIVNFDNYRDAYGSNWSTRANLLIQNDICSLGKLLRQYINNNYWVKFDAIKASISTYSYSQQHKKYIIKNCGVLCKQPRLTGDNYFSLFNSPIFSLSFIHSKIEWLLKLNQVDIETMKKSRLFKINTGDLATTPSSITTITGMSPHLCGRSNKKNEEGSKAADPVERSRHICQQYFRDYYKKNSRLPSFDEYKRYYRAHPSSTGEETEKAGKRLRSVYDYCKDGEDGFDPEKLKKGLYAVGEFIKDLKETIGQEELNQLVENETNYERKVFIEDLDVALGYYFVNLMKNKEKKDFSSKELTVPANDIIKWFKILKEQGQIKRSCNRGKARAIRIILQKIGYWECLDSYYSTDYKVSQRWGFTPKFPRYKEFVEYVGQDTIDKVRKEGQEYLESKKKGKNRKQVA